MVQIPVALTDSQATLKSELASQTSPVVKRTLLLIRAVHLEYSIRKIIILNSLQVEVVGFKSNISKKARGWSCWPFLTFGCVLGGGQGDGSLGEKVAVGVWKV